jgi:hypothetical protein
MPAFMSRPLAAVALLTLTALGLPGEASAHGGDGLISKGVYDGLWHGDRVTIIIEKVSRDGKLSGVIHFDPKGRWGDVKADFTGEIGARDALVIRRSDCGQVARAGAPRRDGRSWAWRGDVTGEGLDRAYPFELKVPR